MLKKTNLKSYAQSLWKNGNGKTRQLAIYPENASIAKNNFHWRISQADVEASNEFSIFLDKKRILVIFQGNGVKLNGKVLAINQPLYFSGNEKISCELIEGAVLDIGLIYDPKFCHAEYRNIHLTHDQEVQFAGDKHFAFFASGDLLEIDGDQKIQFPSSKFNLHIFSISYIS